jgi:opacity protein-like surface antigen
LNWSQTRTGIAGGIGAEWAYIPGVTLRLEYRYTRFGDISQDVPITVTGGSCGSFCTSTAHIEISKLDFQSVRFGVGFGL